MIPQSLVVYSLFCFKAISKIVKSIWKPWNYLLGPGDAEEAADSVTQAPSGPAGDKGLSITKTDDESDILTTTAPPGSIPF